ncbi:aldehyde dehydrogenase family protein [Sorangium sp. So ce388]|uniref:aldehyde dehydrogenase family protein n=1 Tax=Sorangium sp. So ce388 TaxID=3133309 RepID=UPI003F5C2C70
MPIAGVWRAGNSGTTDPDHDPYTGETLVEIPLANARDVDDAYRAAEHAQHKWAAALPQERRDVLERAAHIVEERREEIVGWLVRESGSTRVKAELELRFMHMGLFEAASYPFHVEGRVVPAAIPGKESRVYRGPAGVVGVISPWNFPLHLSNRSVAPAIAVGDAVVLKPASDTPVTGGLLLARIFEEAGLPPGVLSVVVGAGKDIGDAFVDHPVPRIISFTGSTPVGRRIAEHAGRNVKRVRLELGGNCPFIVFDDADLDLAVGAAVAGKFMHQGQICLAINRILVDAGRYTQFMDRFVERVATLKVGNPAEPDTAIGPLINRSQLDRVIGIVHDTIALGAHPVLRGEPSGLVLPPIVLADVTNDMPAAQQEIFGPVAPVLRFRDEEEAIRIANDTEYGLSSSVFTRDVERGVRVAKRIVAGMTHVNDWPVDDEANTAFGGEKASGLGRFGGEWALEEFTTDHWISVQERPHPYPI